MQQGSSQLRPIERGSNVNGTIWQRDLPFAFAWHGGRTGLPPLRPGRQPADAPYPNQAVRLVVPFSAGSVTDILARIIGEKLGERWGQQVIVENRPGLPGTASVAKSAPDGYTLMLTSNGHTVAGRPQQEPAVRSGEGIRRRDAGRLGAAGLDRAARLAGKDAEGIHRARQGQTGHAQFCFVRPRQHGVHLRRAVQADREARYRARALQRRAGIADRHHACRFPYVFRRDQYRPGPDPVWKGAGRSRWRRPSGIATLPDVPTFAEAGMPEFEYDAWFGVMAPASTPIAIRTKVSQDVATISDRPRCRSGWKARGW